MLLVALQQQYAALNGPLGASDPVTHGLLLSAPEVDAMLSTMLTNWEVH